MGTYKPEPNLNGTLEPEVPKVPEAQSSDDSEDLEDAETPTVAEIPRKGESKSKFRLIQTVWHF